MSFNDEPVERGLDDVFPNDPRSPLVPLLPEDDYDYEEMYPKIQYELSTQDIVLFAVRCLTVFLCILGLVLFLVNIGRGNRLKSWRLYFLVALTVFSWVGMTLYQDHIDQYFVQEVTRYPQPRSIYWCFRNLVHGLTLYLIILLLAHLSDMQHRSHWLGLIATVVLVPLVYSIGILIADLRIEPKVRYTWYVVIAIDSIRIFLYNFITTILLFVMSRSFCTRRLYGTYSEQRSGIVVLVARWTYALLLIHNLVTMASYAMAVISRLPETQDVNKFVTIQLALDEAYLFLIVMAVPMSYLIGMCARCCCGVSRDNDLEMDKVDKIYTDVWTTPSARHTSGNTTQVTTTAANTPGSRPPSSASQNGLQNGVVRRDPGRGSSSTISSIGSSSEAAANAANIGMNPGGHSSAAAAARKKRVRESYMEAVSTGSLNEDRQSVTSRHSSVSTDPVDL